MSLHDHRSDKQTRSPGIRRADHPLQRDVLSDMHRSLGNAAVGQLLRQTALGDGRTRVAVQRLQTPEQFAKKIKPGSESDGTLQTILKLLAEYHKARKEAPWTELTEGGKREGREARQQMLTRLYKLNLVIYTWFDSHKSLNIKGVPNSGPLYDLLDDIQMEHQELISKIADKPGELPISQVGVPQEEQERAGNIWRGLLANEGNIRITGDKGFRKEALAGFANLLQSGPGRDLVGSLQQDPTRPEGTELGTPERLISIDPVTSGGFAATQSNLSSTAHLLVKMGDGGNVASDSDEFRPLESSRNLSPQWRKDPESTGITVGKGDSSRSYRYGTGQGSNVAYPRGSRERSHGVKIDESGNQILSPSFITLGHELYHAQHSLEGTAFNTEQASSETDKENQRLLAESSRGDADDYAWYENTEEYVTIAHNENYLREQYGLSSRATHTVQCMYLVGQLDPIKQRLEPENPQYAYIEQLQLVLQKAGWAEIKRSKPVDPEFEGVIAAQEKQVGVLLGDLKMRTIEEALSHVEELLRHAPVEKDLPKSSSSSVIKPQAKATVESPKSSSSRPEGVLPGLMPELPGRLVNVSGDGRNCLIRAVLLAAGVQAYEDYVEPIREHIVKQVGDVERGQMLDLALAEGAILLSYLQSQGLLSAKRALHVYFSTGAHTQVQDGVDPVNIYLSNEHFQAIV